MTRWIEVHLSFSGQRYMLNTDNVSSITESGDKKHTVICLAHGGEITVKENYLSIMTALFGESETK